MILATEKLVAYACAGKMIQLAVAQRRSGDDQTFRVQLRGTSPNSALRIGFVQLESATSSTSGLVLPDGLLCPANRSFFTGGVDVTDSVTIEVFLSVEERRVFYSCEPFGDYAGFPGDEEPVDSDYDTIVEEWTRHYEQYLEDVEMQEWLVETGSLRRVWMHHLEDYVLIDQYGEVVPEPVLQSFEEMHATAVAAAEEFENNLRGSLPLPDGVDARRLFLAAVLNAPSDQVLLLPPDGGNWPITALQAN